ncbi:hypothetical protein [Rubrivirga sp. IMCC43871]|uniref:hypothetical protein n=1 Tax=Rubrivirga sp. IMCC43871 TaxID=3391575 RepID=UPI00398F9BFD
MKLPDWILPALNAVLLAFAFFGFASVDEDTLMVMALLAMITAVLNIGVLIHHSRTRVGEPTPAMRVETTMDELDVHAVLDLDARLEALENAQHDAVDAARWRALVESGQVTGPGAEPLAAGPNKRRNGAADHA